MLDPVLFGLIVAALMIIVGLVGAATIIKHGLKELADAIKERPTSSSATAAKTQHFPGQEDSKKELKKVGELPPEILAPNFTKPPRPAGGFGSRDRQ